MNLKLLNHIRCTCNGSLVVSKTFEKKKDEFLKGILECTNCKKQFSIEGGIPIFIESKFDLRTQMNFGFSWNIFSDIYKRQMKDFLNWLYPVNEDWFKGKVVLDAGCGNGLHAKMASEFGATAVIGIDISSAVNAAYSNTLKNSNVHIIQSNIYNPPFQREYFDYIYSIGVIQHLSEREKSIETLVLYLKKGGSLSLWVYGFEGTFFVRVFIEPIRRVVSKFHPKIIFILSIFPAIGFYFISKVLKTLNSLSEKLCDFFPMGNYFVYMGSFPFKYQFNTVFDQLVAPRTHYFKREELKKIFTKLKFKKISITSRNKMSWRIFAGGKE